MAEDREPRDVPETIATPLSAERPGVWPTVPRPELEAGRRIGPYKVLDLISRGGMGEVYLAVREYEDFDKRVALKILQHDLGDHEELLRRFRTEHRILGFLDHPNISRLLDGGTTENGRPYLVMEYVEGEPIDAFCDSRKLGVRERLEIFLAVCSAVEFAHRNTVVHRDIKPANILVTADGTPKLLDFGIAKLLNPELTARAAAPTRLRAWTPEYASPEQLKDEPITTASDVYSLGVLLYELLTGHHPYPRRTPTELDRAILEEDPPKPSTVVLRAEPATPGRHRAPPRRPVSATRGGDLKKLRRRLAGDLDNILLKALRKEPQRRYPSVEQFADDVRRHLSGHPVVARGDSLAYRAGKFVRRHRFAVSAAAAFVVATLAFGVAMAVQQARLAEALAGEELVTDFLIDLFEVSDPLVPRQQAVSARELLDRGRDKLRVELRDRPEVQSRLMSTVGSVYAKLGQYEEADALLRQALEVRRGLSDRPDGELAEILSTLAAVVRARGSHDEAGEFLREALELRRAVFGDRSPEVAGSLNDLASLLRFQGDLDVAEELYREALSILRTAGDRGHLADALNNLATLHQTRGARDAAEFERAEELFREALDIRRDELGDEHPMVANSLHNLAFLLQKMGRRDAAEPLYRDALEILRSRLGDRHPWLAISLVAYGSLLVESADHAAAEVQVRDALAVLETTLPAGHWQIRSTESLLGECLTGLGRYDEAEPLLTASYRDLLAQQGEGSPYVRRARERVAALYRVWGRPEQAADYDFTP